jgi:hypothetical protein
MMEIITTHNNTYLYLTYTQMEIYAIDNQILLAGLSHSALFRIYNNDYKYSEYQ